MPPGARRLLRQAVDSPGMATHSAADTADSFVTRALLALAAVIFIANLPTLVVFGTPVAKAGAALLYLGGAFAIASTLKLLSLLASDGFDALPR
ncbi:hypothetical protein AFNJKBDN_CDS0047 [Halorubrum virus V_ICIS4]|nr:hypothetical protein AFNJKBDN_CDS0047 [Halorubrum virus V_ICIS4]